jgi:hypothetical protein
MFARTFRAAQPLKRVCLSRFLHPSIGDGIMANSLLSPSAAMPPRPAARAAPTPSCSPAVLLSSAVPRTGTSAEPRRPLPPPRM